MASFVFILSIFSSYVSYRASQKLHRYDDLTYNLLVINFCCFAFIAIASFSYLLLTF